MRERAREDIVIALVGNKVDRVRDREVAEADVAEVAKAEGLLHFVVSAKTGEGVDAVFEAVADAVSEEHAMSAEADAGLSASTLQPPSSLCSC